MPYVFTRLGSGLNLKAPATAINDADLQQAENARFDSLGAVKSRRGRESIHSISGGLSSRIRGAGELVTSDGTVKLITKAGEGIYDGETLVHSTGNEGEISVVSYNGYAYITDGEVQKRYDGTGPSGIEDWGLDAPTTLSAALGGSGGSLVDGTYKYAVTFYNDRCESNLFPDYGDTAVTVTTTTGVNDQVDLTIPVGPANCTGRRIYATAPNGSVFFELKDIANNIATSWTDTRNPSGRLPESDPDSTALDEALDAVRAQNFSIVDRRDAYRRIRGFNQAAQAARATPVAAGDAAQRTMTNLGVMANWTDHDPPPADIRDLRMLNGQVFGISGNSLRWSRTFEPEHWPQFNEVPIGRQGGEELLTIEPFGDNAIACYTTSGLWVFEQLGISAQDSRLRQVPSPVGCWGKNAVTRLENGAHLFGGGDAIYLFDGQRVNEISFTVDGLFNDSDNDDYFTNNKRGSVVAGSYRDKAYFAYNNRTTESPIARNNRLLFLDMEDVSSPRFSVHTGKFSTFVRAEFDNTLVGGTYKGEVVKMDKGLVDGDETNVGFEFEARTKEFAFEEGETIVKRIQHVIVDCDTDEGKAEVEVRAILDRKEIVVTKEVRTIGRERVKFRVPPKVQGQTVSVKYKHTSSKKPRALYGVGFEYEVAGGV